MNAPIFLLAAVWVLFALVELAANFPTCQNGIIPPTDAPPATDADEDSDALPFGPTPSDI
jgi:hypothetical protein